MFPTQTTVVLLGALGLLLSASPITASPVPAPAAAPSLSEPGRGGGGPALAARGEAAQADGTARKANSDVGFELMYTLFTKGLGAKLTKGVITKMVLDGPLFETPAMTEYVVEARRAVDRDDQRAAFEAMRKWSAEADKLAPPPQ